MAAERDSCCTCCFSFIITIGLTALFLWLSLRADEPKCYIEKVYLPALNKSLNSPQNNTLIFTIKLVNGNKDKGIKYDAVQLDFKIFVGGNATRQVGNATVPEFYQGHQKTAHKPGSLLAAGNLSTPVDGKVYFRVDFATKVKYKILVWYTKRYRLWGGANVEIDDSGEKVYRKPIRLGDFPPVIVSGARRTQTPWTLLCASAFFVATLLFLDAHGLT